MLLALLFACASDPLLVPDGAFVLDHATDGSGDSFDAEDLGDIALVVDTEAGTAELSVSDGDLVETVTLTLAARDEADWRTDCATNYTSTPIETFDLGEDVAVGALVAVDAVLTADCGGSPLLAGWADGSVQEPRITFREE